MQLSEVDNREIGVHLKEGGHFTDLWASESQGWRQNLLVLALTFSRSYAISHLQLEYLEMLLSYLEGMWDRNYGLLHYNLSFVHCGIQ
jgi:hypothetical protein